MPRLFRIAMFRMSVAPHPNEGLSLVSTLLKPSDEPLLGTESNLQVPDNRHEANFDFDAML